MNLKNHTNIVSKLFLAAAIIMLLSYPGFKIFLPQYPIFMIGAITLLSVMAGLTNLKGKWLALINIVISIIAIIYFESHAIMFVRVPNLIGIFLIDEILTLIFVLALYFSIKTFRIKSPEIKV